MNQPPDDEKTPRWLKLASALRAEPAPGTMARVRSRLAQREPFSSFSPTWLTWLARPASLAVSTGLLVASAWLGVSLLSTGTVTPDDETTFAAALLQDDGSMGLGLDDGETPGEAGADSQQVEP